MIQPHHRSAQVWHALSKKITVFPDTHAFIHESRQKTYDHGVCIRSERAFYFQSYSANHNFETSFTVSLDISSLLWIVHALVTNQSVFSQVTRLAVHRSVLFICC